ncbi:MAG: hypothetical protein Q8O93_02535 [bacterium]|nr:hypothetical protein [bacterium]
MKQAKSFLAAMALIMLTMITLGCGGGSSNGVLNADGNDASAVAKAIIPVDIQLYSSPSGDSAAKAVMMGVTSDSQLRTWIDHVLFMFSAGGNVVHLETLPVVEGRITGTLSVDPGEYNIMALYQTKGNIAVYSSSVDVNLRPGVNKIAFVIVKKMFVTISARIGGLPGKYTVGDQYSVSIKGLSGDGYGSGDSASWIDSDGLFNFSMVYETESMAGPVELSVTDDDGLIQSAIISFDLLAALDESNQNGFIALAWPSSATIEITGIFAEDEAGYVAATSATPAAVPVRGKVGAPIFRYILKNNLSVPVRPKQILIHVWDANYLYNFFQVDEANPGIPLKCRVESVSSYGQAGLNCESDSVIPAGEALTFSLNGDVLSNYPTSEMFGADVYGAVIVDGDNNQVPFLKSIPMSVGVGSGALTAKVDSATPSSAILIAGSTGNPVMRETYNAALEGFSVDQRRLKVPYYFGLSSAGVTASYKDRYGNNQSATQLFNCSSEQEGCIATFAGLTFYAPANGSVSIDYEVDLISIASGALSEVSGEITLLHDGFHAVSDSGQVITSIGTPDLTGNTFYVRKSKPTFALQNVLIIGSSGIVKLLVITDNAGNIDLKQLGVYFIAGGSEISQASLYDPSAGVYLTDVPVNPSWLDGKGIVRLPVGTVDDDNVLTVAGGFSKSLEVRFTITGYNQADGDYIGFGFVPDTEPGPTADTATIMASGAYNIWSDRSSPAHTVYTKDWTNGYLLKDMTGVQYF